MKKLLIFMLTGLLLLAGPAACSKKPPVATNTPASSENKPAPAEKKDSSEVALPDIMKYAQNIKGAYYEMKMTTSTPQGSLTAASKNWISGKKARIETESMGIKTVTIITADGTVYLYNQNNNMATKVTAPQSENADQWAYKDPAKYKILGREQINGQQCVVISNIDIPEENKLWINEEIGMPIKMISTVAGGTATAEFSNIKLGPQSDDLFTLPNGAKITEMPKIHGYNE